MSFWYVGAALFFLVGRLMRTFWEEANRGNLVCQCVLCLFTFPAMMTFGVELSGLISSLLQFIIFAGPLLYWSRLRRDVGGGPVWKNIASQNRLGLVS